MIFRFAQALSFALLLSFCIDATAESGCASTPGLAQFSGSGWGIDPLNQRYQSDTVVDASNVGAANWSGKNSWTTTLSAWSPVRSAYEVLIAAAPLYGCCDFRGSVVAVDAATGENYSVPATDTSDSVFAVNLDDGGVRWHRQFTPNDAWNAACGAGWLNANCPEADGPDYDFGAPPLLARTAYGQDVLLAGQKSGMVFAMNPDSGELLWQRRLGRGGKLGGIHWGMAVNEKLGLLYVPVSDRGTGGSHETHDPDPGLHALSIHDGSVRWWWATCCSSRRGMPASARKRATPFSPSG